MSKTTKRERKLNKGMNAITKLHLKQGHKPKVIDPTTGKIIQKGTPYVNPRNFGL